MLPLKECDVVALIKKYRTIPEAEDEEGGQGSLANHNLLSVTHTDTNPATVVRGDLIVGQGVTPFWTRLPIGTNGLVLMSDGSDVYWGTPSGVEVHNLLSVTHPDTTAAAVVRGDLITGQGSTATWTRLPIGTSGYVLTSDGTDAYWATPASVTVHNLLSATHPDTTSASVVQGDIIIGQSASPSTTWKRYAIQIPSATHVNYLATYSTDVEPSWKALFDDLAPASITVGATGSAGTSLYAAHRDHVHGSPATWTAAAHNLLSVIHGDTTAADVVQGDLVVGQAASPSTKWKRYAISVPGAGNLNLLGVGYSEVEPTWKTLFDNTLPSTITIGATSAPGSEIVAARRDHVHGSPATWTATPHNLLSNTHPDTMYSEIVRGDIIVRGESKWYNKSLAIPLAEGQSITLQARHDDPEPYWYESFTATLPTNVSTGTSSSTGTSMYFARSDHTHGTSGIAASPHNLLSTTHADTTAASVQRGDLIIGKGYVTYWERLGISIPASNYLNVLAVTSVDTEPAWWSIFGGTTPTAITVGATGSAGTSVYAARIDHTHQSPSTWTATAHNLLSATHGDTTAASCVRGDVIVGSGATPRWTRYAIQTPSDVNGRMTFATLNGSFEPQWTNLFEDANPVAITVGASASQGTSTAASRRDHRHASPSTWTPSAHNLLSSSHGDALTNSVVRGDLISGQGSTTKWDRLALGTSGYFLKSNGTDTVWTAHGLTYSDVNAAPAGHNLLSATYHSDTNTGTVTRGDLVIGWSNGSTTKWDRLAKGTNGYFLKSNSTDVVWAAHGLTYSDLGAHGVSTNYLARATSTTAFGNSLIQDNGTYVGVGKAGTCLLDVNGQVNATSVTTDSFYSNGIADNGSTSITLSIGANTSITMSSTSILVYSYPSSFTINNLGAYIQSDNEIQLGVGTVGSLMINDTGAYFDSDYNIDLIAGTTLGLSGGASSITIENGWVHTGTSGEGSYDHHIHIFDNNVEYVIPCKVPA